MLLRTSTKTAPGLLFPWHKSLFTAGPLFHEHIANSASYQKRRREKLFKDKPEGRHTLLQNGYCTLLGLYSQCSVFERFKQIGMEVESK